MMAQLSAGMAACLSIDRDIALQELPYADLRKRLVADDLRLD